VTLLERAIFPRYHIGESLLPTILPILDLLGAREKVEAFGHQRKPGAFLQWGKEQWSLNFGELSGNTTYAFQVIRSEFDQQLLEHAKSQGVKVKDLQVREIEGREYVFAVKEHPGLATEKVLPEILAALFKSLDFPKTMRWGSGQLRFIRPVRWLLALYGDKLVPLELDGLKSDRLTWGHRFLAEGPYKLRKADDYEAAMGKAKVVIGPGGRIRTITSM